ncbi:MAG TPA: VOC family protein [Gammaproteobacteria bacterium]|nr:VOC family protein [Gammaproteobacteria bacterium]
MPRPSLDHVGVLTSDLPASVRFFEDVIGLKTGDRPDLDFDGAWLYDDDRAVIHLMVLGEFDPSHTGALHHVAFRADGLADYQALLTRKGLPYHTNHVAGVGLTQLFVREPGGITIELNFFGT